MGKYITEETTESIPTWETLESFARQAVQRLLQRALEEEVSELLGRDPWERRSEGTLNRDIVMATGSLGA